MAHRLDDEAGVSRALAIGLRFTPAERIQGRFMRAPDHGDAAPVTQAAVLESIENDFLGGDDEPEDQDENPEGDKPEGDEPEGDEPEGDDPENPEGEAKEPIAFPVSWGDDAKELFAQLPPDLQQKVTEREAQRDKAVQRATTDAANARSNATQEANAALAQHQRQYASHLEQIVGQFAPQPPDPAIAAQDPGRYIQLKAIYDADFAQYQGLMQRAAQARQEADGRETFNRQQEIAQNDKILADHFGEKWTDQAQRRALLTDLEGVGAELGYSAELMGQASAADIQALAKAAEWKAKAAELDQLKMNVKMEAVRAAKGKQPVLKPGTAQTQGERSSRGRDAAWQRAKTERSGDAYAALLDSMGITL